MTVFRVRNCEPATNNIIIDRWWHCWCFFMHSVNWRLRNQINAHLVAELYFKSFKMSIRAASYEPGQRSLRSWRDAWAGEAAIFLAGFARENFRAAKPRVKFPPATFRMVFACRPLLSLLMIQLNKSIRERSVTWNLRSFTHETARMHATRRK